jgi:hypothetical protein
MSVKDQLASSLGQRDEAPNIALAHKIAEETDKEAIRELIDLLGDSDKGIQNDCIKVLYEIGERKPELIAEYVKTFVGLLKKRNNRLVWGGMTALGSVSRLKQDVIWTHIDAIIRATENGSAITQDWGIRVLATVSAKDTAYEARIFPFLTDFLRKCRPKDLPRHAESVTVAINAINQTAFLDILKSRNQGLKPSQQKRIAKVIKSLK